MQLYTHVEDVDAINSRHMAELSGKPVRFVAKDSGNAAALDSACSVSAQWSTYRKGVRCSLQFPQTCCPPAENATVRVAGCTTKCLHYHV